MKKTLLKSALIALAGIGLMAGSAEADFITGGVSFVGFYVPIDVITDVNNNTIYSVSPTLENAEGLDFTGGPDVDGTLSLDTGEVIFGSRTFDFAGIPTIGTIKDFLFVNFSPVSNFWSATSASGITYSFDLDTINAPTITTNENNTQDLKIIGEGTLYITGGTTDFDATFGNFVLTANSAGNQTFSFSGSTIASPVPEPATMLLFGTGLAGLAGIARRRKK